MSRETQRFADKIEELATDLQEFLDSKSDHWQAGDKGEDVHDVIQHLEDAVAILRYV